MVRLRKVLKTKDITSIDVGENYEHKESVDPIYLNLKAGKYFTEKQDKDSKEIFELSVIASPENIPIWHIGGDCMPGTNGEAYQSDLTPALGLFKRLMIAESNISVLYEKYIKPKIINVVIPTKEGMEHWDACEESDCKSATCKSCNSAGFYNQLDSIARKSFAPYKSQQWHDKELEKAYKKIRETGDIDLGTLGFQDRIVIKVSAYDELAENAGDIGKKIHHEIRPPIEVWKELKQDAKEIEADLYKCLLGNPTQRTNQNGSQSLITATELLLGNDNKHNKLARYCPDFDRNRTRIIQATLDWFKAHEVTGFNEKVKLKHTTERPKNFEKPTLADLIAKLDSLSNAGASSASQNIVQKQIQAMLLQDKPIEQSWSNAFASLDPSNGCTKAELAVLAAQSTGLRKEFLLSKELVFACIRKQEGDEFLDLDFHKQYAKVMEVTEQLSAANFESGEDIDKSPVVSQGEQASG